MKVMCDYCDKPAALVTGKEIYPHLPNLAALKFWQCAPCGAYVGCHRPGVGYGDGTVPLGRLADSELRHMKQRVHRAFDEWWKSYAQWSRHPAFDPTAKYDGTRRKRLYAWLAKELDIPPEKCHTGMFDIATCKRALRALDQVQKGPE